MKREDIDDEAKILELSCVHGFSQYHTNHLFYQDDFGTEFHQTRIPNSLLSTNFTNLY